MMSDFAIKQYHYVVCFDSHQNRWFVDIDETINKYDDSAVYDMFKGRFEENDDLYLLFEDELANILDNPVKN